MSTPPSAVSSPKNKHKLLRRGKVKEVYEISDDVLEFHFSDDISVFDKKIPNLIPHKGETLARTSAHWFRACTKLGVNHHFIDLPEPTRMRVRRVEVVPNLTNHPKKSVLIPLEVVVRYYIAGTLWDRIRSGKTPPSAVGLPAGTVPKYGDKLPGPHFEYTTKLEHVDRLLTREEALQVGGITNQIVSEIEEIVLKVDQAIAREVEPRGLIHVDGKKEFAFDEHGKVMLVDTFGTADEDRFWESNLAAAGKYEEFSKEFVRQHYRKTGYYQKLTEAREKHLEEPPMPPLPPTMVNEVSRLYTTLYERLTGEPFASHHSGGSA